MARFITRNAAGLSWDQASDENGVKMHKTLYYSVSKPQKADDHQTLQDSLSVLLLRLDKCRSEKLLIPQPASQQFGKLEKYAMERNKQASRQSFGFVLCSTEFVSSAEHTRISVPMSQQISTLACTD